jgi:hypothetical protein
MAKNKRHRKNSNKKILQPVQVNISLPPINKQGKTKWYNKVWAWIGVAAVLAGLLASYEPIWNIFKSDKEKFEEEYFKQGDLIPPFEYDIDSSKTDRTQEFISEGFIDSTYDINVSLDTNARATTNTAPEIKGILLKDYDYNEDVHIMLGSNVLDWNPKQVSEISRGIHGGASDFVIYGGIKGKRLYLDIEFKDLLKEETIGFIEYNHWKLYKPNMLDYNYTDSSIEVKDKQNNIALSLKYKRVGNEAGIDLAGYFIGSNDVVTIANSGEGYMTKFLKNSPNWKQEASKWVKRNIKTIF